EIADETTAAVLGAGKPLGDDVEIAPQALAGRAGGVPKRLSDEALQILEIKVEHLARELLLPAKMVGERARRRWRLGDNVAHPCPDIAFAEHDLEASFEDAIAVGGLRHRVIIRTYVLLVKHAELNIDCRTPGDSQMAPQGVDNADSGLAIG